ncbi:hypothetical protein B0H10DRAFT_2226101 [Mycena sp. CBHHK59/15]|nr:hypothetical protein B0H10DRAFT_2226101 [Mycena sp. CBHHK59/15]
MPVPVSNDPLASQLNDLALANSEGLLNDDEYRLLRQNLFERYSGGLEILSISRPVVPVASTPSPSRRKHLELVYETPPQPQATVTRSKTSGVTGFLRRATGRKPTPISPTPPSNVIKLSFIPRMFSKKPEDTSSFDTDSSGTRHSSSRSFSRKASSPDLLPGHRQDGLSPTSPISTRSKHGREPPSPSRSKFEVTLTSPSTSISSQSKYDVVPGGSKDIFDDENLQTAEAIRTAIALVEAEGRRLVAAFNDLETSAVIRYRQNDPQRQCSDLHNLAASPTSPTGSLRRLTPTPTPTPTSPSGSAHTRLRSRANSQRIPNADAQSVHSSSSLRTTKSTASFYHSATPQSAPPSAAASVLSALSPRRGLPSLRRKTSASSVSSQGAPSFLSVGRAAGAVSPTSSSATSRSTGHLPLPPPSHGSGSSMMELLSPGAPPAGEGGEELAEVRRRRAEMMGRCEARLEYLRAKLKGAEIREKLLRK